MTIKIITIGNKPSSELASLITEYTKRFPSSISFTWQYLKHSTTNDVNTSKLQESESILRIISPKDYVILLDEKGEQLTSPSLSNKLFTGKRDVVFIIGGAYGVTGAIHSRADFIWSLSKLVFPHQIVRLMLSEQIYRAYTISVNHPYHHS